MAKKPTATGTTETRRGRGSSPRPATAPPRLERKAETMKLMELRPGLFLNLDHVVSVRVLPTEEDDLYAILQLSSGEKQNLTRGEFTEIVGEEPRSLARLPQE